MAPASCGVFGLTTDGPKGMLPEKAAMADPFPQPTPRTSLSPMVVIFLALNSIALPVAPVLESYTLGGVRPALHRSRQSTLRRMDPKVTCGHILNCRTGRGKLPTPHHDGKLADTCGMRQWVWGSRQAGNLWTLPLHRRDLGLRCTTTKRSTVQERIRTAIRHVSTNL